jgi:regulator of sirC expression with transglutaminase-like and TPR domain
MKESEIKALVSLLDDPDQEVATIVEEKIKSLGEQVIPFLQDQSKVHFRVNELIKELQLTAIITQIENWKESNSSNLMVGMHLVVKYLYPDFSFQRLSDQFNQIYYEAWVDFKSELHPTDQIKLLNHVFFTKLKFGANTKNFHSADNSMLNVVMDSKKGNPISLCVIYMLVAQKLGLPIFGVNLPNLFVLTFKSEQLQFYINVFNKGIVFSKKDIDQYLSQAKLPKSETFYEPCSNITIVRRVLKNIAVTYEKTSDEDRQQEILQILKALD